MGANLASPWMLVFLLRPESLSPSIAEHRARIVRQLEEAQELAKANTQLAQPKMKLLYDRSATATTFEPGEKVWIFTPKTRKGLSRRLLFNWHGPYRVIKRLSPVHYLLRTASNNRVTSAVHVNRMKLFFDPDDRPIQGPTDGDVPEPYLFERDLPDDSFEASTETEPVAAQDPEDGPAPPPPVANVPTGPEQPAQAPLDDPDVFLVERILKSRTRNGQREYLIKWQGYTSKHNSWENSWENILNQQLVADFHRDHPPTASLSPATMIAGLAPASPLHEIARPRLIERHLKVPLLAFLLFLCASIVLPTTAGYGYDSANQRVVYFSSGMMVSHHSKATAFYSETVLVNVKANLGAVTSEPDLQVTTNCSATLRHFLTEIIDSTRHLQRVVNRLVSLQSATNLIECDSYLRRFYRYATGLIFRTIYESTGHDCSNNHVTHVKTTLMDFMTSLLNEQHMIRAINGKTVILTKITDSLNTKMNSLFSTLAMVNTNFKIWQVALKEKSSIHDCRFNTFLEFFSKFSAAFSV